MLRHEGKVVGACSAFPSEVGLVGGRRFWIYRSLLDPEVADQDPAMIRATFEALEAEFDGSVGAPIGLCVLVADPEARRRRPQAEWTNPRMSYAGYLADGRQVRIGYFPDALITSGGQAPPQPQGSSLRGDFKIALFAAQQEVGGQDVVDFWAGEGVLASAEAERRVAEVLVVATDAEGRPVGVSTAYLRHNNQLRAELWNIRVFVAAAHRQSHLAVALAMTARDHLIERFVSGTDPRGIGMIFEVESEILKRSLPQAIWPRTEFVFIGEDPRGSHIRVHYFPGALAPDPSP